MKVLETVEPRGPSGERIFGERGLVPETFRRSWSRFAKRAERTSHVRGASVRSDPNERSFSTQVAVRYPRGRGFFESDYDPCNTDQNMVWHFARPCFEFWNNMRVDFLAPLAPVSGEPPRDFAARTRAALAETLGVPTTEHTHDDLRLAHYAAKRGARAAPAFISVQETPYVFRFFFDFWRPVSRSVWGRFGSFLDR